MTKILSKRYRRLNGYDFVEAKQVIKNRNLDPRWIMIHTAETKELTNVRVARNLANWAASPDCPVSWHFAVDDKEVIQCADLSSQVAADRGTNALAIHIELSGEARQSREEWYDVYSEKVIVNAEILVARLCRCLEIPVRYSNWEALTRGERGITTHNDSRLAFKQTTHTDPGPHFPMKEFVEDVRDFWFPYMFIDEEKSYDDE